jgi:excisionase family DNA binding protein
MHKMDDTCVLDGRRLLTTGDVAFYTQYSAKTIYRAVTAGDLKSTRRQGQLRFRLRDVDAWLAGQKPLDT